MLASLCLLAACDDGVIRIGLAGAISDSLTVSMKHAADVAVEEINAQGGINGRRLELVERDDYGNPDSAVAIANAFYHSDVVAVVGHSFSGPTIAAAPVYNGGRTPLAQISPSASSPDVTEAGDYTFRVCPSDLAHGAALARWAREKLGFHRGAVLYNNNGYGRGIRRTFVAEFTRLGGSLLAIDPYLGDQPDVTPYMERLATQDAEFILVAGYRSEAEQALREARARNISVPFMGGDGLEQIELSGALAEGLYLTAAYSPDIATPANQRFVNAYTRKFPTGAAPNQSAAGTYDAIHLLARIIADVGTDRGAIRNALADVGTARPAFPGVTRAIAFDSAGDLADQQVFIGVVRGGQVFPAEER